ncbi:uncharacterized protein LOC663706 [Tribolium castaneum]|uniref:Protein sleepless n=1 Tax=Tribolium castaneum TaxID=7070 RepID=D6WWK8_TRICA|nr:PREDICTED: uncharacterized protein LOC663706 [Tribolium castaneum]EFA08123.1 hypothetical protein TcasGA2_TC005727 [Tribolium castaneum]|eukprot:XP_976462.1 PREDICTED: uncharacterized protein LOC663706 [Tribolium castaneum]
MNTRALFLLSVVAFASVKAELKCYDCEPHQSGCLSPATANIKSTVCLSDAGEKNRIQKEINDINKLDISPRGNFEENAFECFSLYFEADDANESGVYRGCVEKTKTVISSCDYLTETLKNGNVSNCKTCAENECNVHDVGGGATGVTVSVALVVLNLVICLNVLHF